MTIVRRVMPLACSADAHVVVSAIRVAFVALVPPSSMMCIAAAFAMASSSIR